MHTINESYGVIHNSKESYRKLLNLIIDYIFSVEGLKSDIDILGEEACITKNILESFYERTHSYQQMPSDIIPYWVGKFNVCITNDDIVAQVECKKFSDDNVDFEIYINPYNCTYKPDQLTVTLAHELRHVYTNYLSNKYNFRYIDNIKSATYNDILAAAPVNIDTVLEKWGLDYVVLNEKVYDTPQDVRKHIATSLYLCFKTEILSFTEEFGISAEILLKNHSKDVIKSIKHSYELKKNYKNLDNGQKFDSNVLNNLPVSQYNIFVYRIYKVENYFLNGLIKKVQEPQYKNIIIEAVKDCPCLYGLMLSYLNDTSGIKVDKLSDEEVFNYIGDFIEYIRDFYVKNTKDVLLKMDNTFAREVQKFIDKNQIS